MSVTVRMKKKTSQRGSSLVELMVAMAILAVGSTAIAALFSTALLTNNRSGRDTTGTMLAKMVTEQISSMHTNSLQTVVITDCAGTQWTIATAPGPSPNGYGANLITSSTDPNYGYIDQTQAYSNITTNYAMKYVDCGNPLQPGQQTTYDVRWNVMTVATNVTRMITVSARPASASSSQLGNLYYMNPVTLRTISGP